MARTRTSRRTVLKKTWKNPNEPREGSRRSQRKRVPVFKAPDVIRHRLLLEPTLARRKARKRRREQDNDHDHDSSDGKSTLDKRTERMTRKDELRRKLGPHGLGNSESVSVASESKIAATPDNILSQQPAPSNHSATTFKTNSHSRNRSAKTTVSHPVEGPPKYHRAPTPPLPPPPPPPPPSVTVATRTKPRKSPPKRTATPKVPTIQSPAAARTSNPASTAPHHCTAAPKEPIQNPTAAAIASPVEQPTTIPKNQHTDGRGVAPNTIPIRNQAAYIASPPVGLSTCDSEIQSFMAWNHRQILEDTQTLKMLQKRERAIQLMQRAVDVPSVIASARLVREFYQGVHMDSATRVVLEEAEGRGMVWLSKLLTRSFSKPVVLGGIGFPAAKAKLIADEIVINLGDMIGKIDTTYHTLVGIHILPNDAVLIVPNIREIARAIKEKSLAFRQDIILKAQTSFGLQMMPTASYPSSLSFGTSMAYGF
ncbi:unnamed protein product [Cylindrotheca closterium]|uniref:Uncharacterized protein n=1 Tax=Cylindrotheca closterium TaxID=2856 RepID=A0AAD2JLZ2_9STRA|nr:unnamed protein product [Cylindrotheca closterium]